MISRKILLLLLTLPIILGLIVGSQIINDENIEQRELIQDSCNIRTENNNKYIKEYVIPDRCSAPVAITIDDEGLVWFIENNHSKIVSFNPNQNSFIEIAKKNKKRYFILDTSKNTKEAEKIILNKFNTLVKK